MGPDMEQQLLHALDRLHGMLNEERNDNSSMFDGRGRALLVAIMKLTDDVNGMICERTDRRAEVDRAAANVTPFAPRQRRAVADDLPF
jgi:hypothetical protein